MPVRTPSMLRCLLHLCSPATSVVSRYPHGACISCRELSLLHTPQLCLSKVLLCENAWHRPHNPISQREKKERPSHFAIVAVPWLTQQPKEIRDAKIAILTCPVEHSVHFHTRKILTFSLSHLYPCRNSRAHPTAQGDPGRQDCDSHVPVRAAQAQDQEHAQHHVCGGLQEAGGIREASL